MAEVTHAGIAVVARDTGRVLMQQRAWDETDAEDVRGTWEFPSGGLEDGEDPQAGAWREFCEETGLPQPEGEVVNGWANPEGNYQGFVFAVPVEQEAFEALNPALEDCDTINPDDPERVNPDITAWFTVEQMRGLGPALRPEVAEMDWSVFDLEAEMTETAAARKWFGVIAPEGVKSGDKRMFAPGALRMRSLPLPLTWQKVSNDGHKGNVTVASIQETWRENGLIWGAGEWMDTPEADEAYALVEHFGRYGVSIDADDLDEFSIELTDDGTTVFTDARQCSACIVSIPAFAEAFVMNGDYKQFKADFAGGWGAPSQQIPTRENEGQDECEERDEDGNCIEREPDAERKEMSVTAAVEDPVEEEPEEEGEPCDPENDPDCVAREDSLLEQEQPFRDVSKDERDDLADEGKAMPDGSYPIANEADLKNAIQSIGRAKDPEAVKRHIKKRANALGKSDLIPEDWSVSTVETFEQWAQTWNATNSPGMIQMKDLAPGLTEDGPGWLTHPVDTDRLRDYWVRGPGAAKIGWGTPDDFYRCEANVAEYVKPQYIKGYCANRHYDALGYWPGQAPHKGEAIAMTASAQTEINGVLVGEEDGGASLTAAAPMKNPPRAWFENPGLEGPTALTVTEDGHVFGHLATWGQCHVGFKGECILLPKSKANYSYFHIGVVQTDAGEVYTGPLVMGGKHAGERLNWRQATQHYDDTTRVVADIVVGEDEHGVYMTGALREGVSERDIRELRAAGKASGDWREVVQGSAQLELIAALAVNVGGFPVPRVQIAAKEGRVVSLVAAGIVEDDPIAEITDEVMARIDARQAMKALRAEVYGSEIAALTEGID
jgi:8-oxo-dGTP pyrophosphatase MutT (NUDIX family)